MTQGESSRGYSDPAIIVSTAASWQQVITVARRSFRILQTYLLPSTAIANIGRKQEPEGNLSVSVPDYLHLYNLLNDSFVIHSYLSGAQFANAAQMNIKRLPDAADTAWTLGEAFRLLVQYQVNEKSIRDIMQALPQSTDAASQNLQLRLAEAMEPIDTLRTALGAKAVRLVRSALENELGSLDFSTILERLAAGNRPVPVSSETTAREGNSWQALSRAAGQSAALYFETARSLATEGYYLPHPDTLDKSGRVILGNGWMDLTWQTHLFSNMLAMQWGADLAQAARFPFDRESAPTTASTLGRHTRNLLEHCVYEHVAIPGVTPPTQSAFTQKVFANQLGATAAQSAAELIALRVSGAPIIEIARREFGSINYEPIDTAFGLARTHLQAAPPKRNDLN